jgi:hypothetical protein
MRSICVVCDQIECDTRQIEMECPKALAHLAYRVKVQIVDIHITNSEGSYVYRSSVCPELIVSIVACHQSNQICILNRYALSQHLASDIRIQLRNYDLASFEGSGDKCWRIREPESSPQTGTICTFFPMTTLFEWSLQATLLAATSTFIPYACQGSASVFSTIAVLYSIIAHSVRGLTSAAVLSVYCVCEPPTSSGELGMELVR